MCPACQAISFFNRLTEKKLVQQNTAALMLRIAKIVATALKD
jgi:hypothetical protein